MLRAIASALVVVATAAPAQITSYETNRPTPVRGDADKIVCKKTESIGTRLGAKKVCLTVQEWEDRAKADRETTENVQKLSDVRESN